VEETEVGVLPSEDDKGVVRCARVRGRAYVREVSPLARVDHMVVKVINFVIGDYGVGVRGVGV
jgi:hypothetical protein